jgi:hypothetical protein
MGRGCNRIFSSPISYRKYTTFPYLYDNFFDGLRIRLLPFLTYFRWAAPAAKPHLRWAAPSAAPIATILRRFAAATGGKGGCCFSHEVALYSKYRWAATYFYNNNLTLLTLFRWVSPAATPYLRWAAPSASPIATILRRFAAATRGKSVCCFSHEVALYSKC